MLIVQLTVLLGLSKFGASPLQCQGYEELLAYLKLFNNVMIDNSRLPHPETYDDSRISNVPISNFDLLLFSFIRTIDGEFKDFNRALQNFNSCPSDYKINANGLTALKITYNILKSGSLSRFNGSQVLNDARRDAMLSRDEYRSNMMVDASVLTEFLDVLRNPIDTSVIDEVFDFKDSVKAKMITNLIQPISTHNSVSDSIDNREASNDILLDAIFKSYHQIYFREIPTHQNLNLFQLTRQIVKHSSELEPLINKYNSASNEAIATETTREILVFIVDVSQSGSGNSQKISSANKDILRQFIAGNLHSIDAPREQLNFLYTCLYTFRDSEQAKCPSTFIQTLKAKFFSGMDESDQELHMLLSVFQYTVWDMMDRKIFAINADTRFRDLPAVIEQITEFEQGEWKKLNFDAINNFMVDYEDRDLTNEMLHQKYDNDSFRRSLRAFIRPFGDLNSCSGFVIREDELKSGGVFYAILMTRIFSNIDGRPRTERNVNKMMAMLSNINKDSSFMIHQLNVTKVIKELEDRRNAGRANDKPRFMTEEFLKLLGVFNLSPSDSESGSGFGPQDVRGNELGTLLYSYVALFSDSEVEDFTDFSRAYKSKFNLSQLTDRETREFDLESHMFFKILQGCNFSSRGPLDIKKLPVQLAECKQTFYSKTYHYGPLKSTIGRIGESNVDSIVLSLPREEDYESLILLIELSRLNYYPQLRSFDSYLSALVSNFFSLEELKDNTKELLNFFSLLKLYNSQPEGVSQLMILDKKIMKPKSNAHIVFTDLMRLRDELGDEKASCSTKVLNFLTSYVSTDKYSTDEVRSSIESRSDICPLMLFSIVRRLSYIYGTERKDEYVNSFFAELKTYFGADFDREKIEAALSNFYSAVESFLYNYEVKEVSDLDSSNFIQFLISHRQARNSASSLAQKTELINSDDPKVNALKIDMNSLRDFLSEYFHYHGKEQMAHFEIYSKYFENNESFVENFKALLVTIYQNQLRSTILDKVSSICINRQEKISSELVPGTEFGYEFSDASLIRMAIDTLYLHDTELMHYLNGAGLSNFTELYKWLALARQFGTARSSLAICLHITCLVLFLIFLTISVMALLQLISGKCKKRMILIPFEMTLGSNRQSNIFNAIASEDANENGEINGSNDNVLQLDDDLEGDEQARAAAAAAAAPVLKTDEDFLFDTL